MGQIDCLVAGGCDLISMKTHVGPGVTLSAVIIRACWVCGGKRELGKPCGSCGDKTPPQVSDLGVIASHQKSRWERFKWNIWAFHMAQRRIKKINEEMIKNGIR
jgi:hypothetical protein